MPNLDVATPDDLHDLLLRQLQGLSSGSLEAKDAVEVNNTAGKIIGLMKTRIVYHIARGEKPKIEFLDRKKTTGIPSCRKQIGA